MPTYKIAKTISDIEKHVIVNIEQSQKEQFIGIKTQNSVLFLNINGNSIKVVDQTIVPTELLEKLGLEFGLIQKAQPTTRGK